jgi:hypothetical protein
MTSQTTCPESSRLQQLLDDALPATERAQLQEHLGACRTCQLALERLAGAPPSWHDMARDVRDAAAPAPKPSPALRQLLDEVKAVSDATIDGSAGAEKEDDADQEADFTFLGPSDRPGYLGQLGHYQVMELIGRGGMGIVFKAFDTVLQRVVAVKVLAPQLAANGTARRRFLREARAAAAVCHEHIVTIHAVEEQSGLPYIVMQYISGISLQEKIKKQGPLEVKEVLRVGLQAAQGLAMAHAHGLVHRDIKPANILLENGIEKVRITDFGLARAMDDGAISQSGVVAGTPQYMAPEQARGEPVSPRADLFSLGGVLYAMCTGQPPFKGSNSLSILKRVCEENPRPIHEINPEAPAWLVEVIGKLMAKSQDERYQTAAEVAELLQQHLAVLQQPTGANLVPVSGPVRETSRRRVRLWPWAAAVVLLGLAAVAANYLVPGLFADKPALARLELETGDADLQVLVVQDGKTVAVLDAKKQATLELPPGTYDLHLGGGEKDRKLSADRVTLAAGGKHILWAGGLVRTMVGHPEGHGVWGVAISPDGTWAVSCGDDTCVRKWELATGRQLWERKFDFPDIRLGNVAVSADGKLALVAASNPPVAVLLDTQSGAELRRFEGHKAFVLSVSFSKDGLFALTAGGTWYGEQEQDNTARLWEVKTGKEIQKFEGHAFGAIGLRDPPPSQRFVSSAVFSPDGKKVLTGSFDRTARLWSTQTGMEIGRFEGHELAVFCAVFSPNGKQVLTCGWDRDIRLWDVATFQELRRFRGHTNKVSTVVFSHDGTRALSASEDGTMRLWEVATAKELCRLTGHNGRVHRAVLSPDDKYAVSGGMDGSVRLWRLPSVQESAPTE